MQAPADARARQERDSFRPLGGGIGLQALATSDSWLSSFRTRIRAYGTTSAHAQTRRPPQTVLFHPDCNRRLRNRTESADPSSREKRRRSRAWATSPLPPVGIFTPP